MVSNQPESFDPTTTPLMQFVNFASTFMITVRTNGQIYDCGPRHFVTNRSNRKTALQLFIKS